jgi:predicted phage-related endonuclease
MPITETQRKNRIKHLGGSDLPVLFGLSRFKTPYDLWLEKTGQAEDAIPENDAMKAGKLFEDGVIAFAEEHLGKIIRNQRRVAPASYIEHLGKIIRNQRRVAPASYIASNIDGIVKSTGEPIEIKVEGLFYKLRDGWGDSGTDNVPYDVIVQAHAHILTSGSELCHVAAFLAGKGFCLYKIQRDQELIDLIQQKAAHFWENHVLTNIPPQNSTPTIEVLKRVKREPVTVDVEPYIVNEYLLATQARKEAEAAEEEARRRLLSAMGTGEAVHSGDNLITYTEQERTAIDSKKLRTDHPDIYAECTTKTTYRVLRTKTLKQEK